MPEHRDPFGPNLPGFSQVPFDDLVAIDAAVWEDNAPVILEPIPGTLGMRIPADDYLPGVEAICRDSGALLIVDEVQAGLAGPAGRVGSRAGQRHDPGDADGPASFTLLDPDVIAILIDQHV